MTALAPVLYYVPVFSWLRIAEPPPDPLSEADLSLLWAGQRFPAAALATPDGRPVTVLNPGRKLKVDAYGNLLSGKLAGE